MREVGRNPEVCGLGGTNFSRMDCYFRPGTELILWRANAEVDEIA